tara:strand:- start:1995 stop:2738 length:744 start_codon:yes stop_codon:yes gene_type:complete
MIVKIYLVILVIFLNFSFGLEADEILYKTLERFKGIDRHFTIEIIEQKNGKKKYKKFLSWTHWDMDNIKKERVLMIKPDRLKNVNFWSYSINGDIKKWMTMPKIGKLKEVRGNFSKKDEFDFSELELKKENIENHLNSIIGSDIVNYRDTYIIENKKLNKKGEVRLIKKIWIDKKDYIIHKAVYINRKGKVIKEIYLSDLLMVNNYPILSTIQVVDFKKNKEVSILFSDISFDKIVDVDMFIPRSLK